MSFDTLAQSLAEVCALDEDRAQKLADAIRLDQVQARRQEPGLTLDHVDPNAPGAHSSRDLVARHLVESLNIESAAAEVMAADVLRKIAEQRRRRAAGLTMVHVTNVSASAASDANTVGNTKPISSPTMTISPKKPFSPPAELEIPPLTPAKPVTPVSPARAPEAPVASSTAAAETAELQRQLDQLGEALRQTEARSVELEFAHQAAERERRQAQSLLNAGYWRTWGLCALALVIGCGIGALVMFSFDLDRITEAEALADRLTIHLETLLRESEKK